MTNENERIKYIFDCLRRDLLTPNQKKWVDCFAKQYQVKNLLSDQQLKILENIFKKNSLASEQCLSDADWYYRY